MANKDNFLSNHMNTYGGSWPKAAIALIFVVMGGPFLGFCIEGKFNPSYLPGSIFVGVVCVGSAIWLKRRYKSKE
jgi:hypothetical protein